jgi:quercetin 2,3-dioxygenase
MKPILHRANSRGTADHGWLKSSHTFSFAGYFNPERMGFGKLRVLNDDFVEGGKGFATHSHKNMEIVSIPLAGGLEHKDSMGNTHLIQKGEIQVMSAGTGVTHSEYNISRKAKVNFLQIWVLPDKMDVKPHYQQNGFDPKLRENKFQLIVSPDGRDKSLDINQNAFFSLANIKKGNILNYQFNASSKTPDSKAFGRGVYIFIIDGRVEINGEMLGPRDAIGLSQEAAVHISAAKNSEILCIEVSMN